MTTDPDSMISDSPGLDRLAIGLSGLCLVHCLASVLAVSLFATAGGLLNHTIHEIGLVVAIILGALALGRGALAHRSPLPIALGGAGLALMALGVFQPEGRGEIVCTVAGVAILAFAHYLNRHATLRTA